MNNTLTVVISCIIMSLAAHCIDSVISQTMKPM